jgi:hypothetical protein
VVLSGANTDGASEVPLTPVHIAYAAAMVLAISASCPEGVWFAVKIVAGFVPRDVLHWIGIPPAPEMFCRVGCGQAVPPETLAACRMSAT